VKLNFTTTSASIEVTDDGIATAPVASVGTGRGLIGLHERAELFGGRIESGPVNGRGWRVMMELPTRNGVTHGP
jgi:signal transduction histidine kinase